MKRSIVAAFAAIALLAAATIQLLSHSPSAVPAVSAAMPSLQVAY
jgi:hypothetical protein